jgi:hypothetical protein
LVFHCVDIHLANIIAFRVLERWQFVVDLITYVQVPLGLNVFCELRGRVGGDVHVEVDFKELSHVVTASNNCTLSADQVFLVSLNPQGGVPVKVARV